MATSSIPVDLRNPGQVFACLGLMEAAEILIGPATGGFVWKDQETLARFILTAPGGDDPVLSVLRFLTQAEAVALAPAGSGMKDSHKTKTIESKNLEFPCPQPSETSLPIILKFGDLCLPISHWVENLGSYRSINGSWRSMRRDSVKFWAGNNSGANIANLGLSLLPKADSDELMEAAYSPFSFTRPQTSSFRFAWQRDYTAQDVGFSPNDHSEIRMMGYPFLELLAAVGLQNARPCRQNKLCYRYGVWQQELPTIFARAMLGLGNPGFPIRTFTMYLVKSGQDDRCIKDALEDTQS